MIDRIKEKKVVGIKQAAKAIKSGIGNILYVAKDADPKILDSLVKAAKENKVEVKYIETMKELGKLCGIDVGAAATVTIKE